MKHRLPAIAAMTLGLSASLLSAPGAMASTPTTAAPSASAQCVFELGVVQTCSSTNPDVILNFNDLGGGNAECTFKYILEWGDSSSNQTATINGSTTGGPILLSTHTYKTPGTYTIKGLTDGGTCSEVPGQYTFTLEPAPTAQCTKNYNEPASWNTGVTRSTTKGIPDYQEPLNVVISACSNVPLSEIRAAMTDWVKTISICVSPETADVAGRGYVTQQQAWRYEGCIGGNKLSLAGLENHARFWSQPAAGSKYGAWFVTASYETACVSVNGVLYPLASKEGLRSLHFFHCIDGGKGSYDTDGYNRGAKDLAHDVAQGARQKGWKVTESTITRSLAGGPTVGEDNVAFNGTVYVLQVTR